MQSRVWFEEVALALKRRGKRQTFLITEAKHRWGQEIEPTKLSRVLSGKRPPEPELLAMICLILDLDPTEIGIEVPHEWKIVSEATSRFRIAA